MITEDDLRLVLQQMSDAAPERCSARPRPRRRVVPAAVAAAIVAAAVLVSVAAVGWNRHLGEPSVSVGSRSSTPASVDPAPVLPHFRPSVTPATFLPTTAQRRTLTAIGVGDGKDNGDGRPRVSTVGTTLDRLCALDPSWFCIGSAVRTARELRIASATARVWVVWTQGHFDGGNVILGTLVDGATMRGRAGTADLDIGYGVDPQQLSELGVVVRLR